MFNEFIFIFGMSILGGYFIFLVVMFIKMEVTYKQYMELLFAIYDYSEANNPLEYQRITKNMTDYTKIAYDWSKWGYKNILPEEDFKKIEKYIKC